MTERRQTQLPVISLFSGAMGFDLGVESAGLHLAVCVDHDKRCCETIRLNRPDIPLIENDIRTVSTSQILRAAHLRKGQALAVIGGPPCQSFSTGGKRGSILDPRGSLFMEFIRIIRESQPKCFVFENVAHLVTAPIKHRPIHERPGRRWHLSSYSEGMKNGDQQNDGNSPMTPDELAGSALNVILEEFEKLDYHLDIGVLNAADYGVPQRRLRLVIIGSRLLPPVVLPKPTNAASPSSPLQQPWRTLRDALNGLKEETPRHAVYTDRFMRYFAVVPPGGNWRDLPPNIQEEALGKAFAAGGGKTGFFRRLAWDAPTPTIVGKPNRKSSAICHPEELRPLTVRECARVQGFPDNWRFSGSMHDQYLQVGNAVPVGLGQAIGMALIDGYEKSNGRVARTAREKHELASWRKKKRDMLHRAKQVVRRAACNKAAAAARNAQAELPFEL